MADEPVVAGSAGSQEQLPSGTSTPTPSDRVPIVDKQHNERKVDESVGSTSAPTVPRAMGHPSTSPSAATKEKKRPSLLKPEYKTAAKDFIVSDRPPQSLFPTYATAAHLLLLNMAGQAPPGCCRPHVGSRRRHHARHEHRFRYGFTLRGRVSPNPADNV